MQHGTLLVIQSASRGEMMNESLTISHLSVAMTTTEADSTHTTDGKGMTSSFSFDAEFYFELAVIFIGIVGTAGNALILYALVASRQHKKHLLIVNQNALDLFSSFFLVLVYSLRLCNLRLSGDFGYWLCITLLSEYLVWWATNGSILNLVIITIDRYLKVVHPVLSRKYLRTWVIYCAMASAWILSLVYNTIIIILSTEVRDGACHAFVVFASVWHLRAYTIWYVAFFYVIIIVIFVFCYWRILMAIRQQASVMAAHSGPRSSGAQAQSNQIQSNVIKTMVLVSAFYAVAWLPVNVYYAVTSPTQTFVDRYYYTTMFIAFSYTSANPFIYATKFDAVRKFLIGKLPCKKNHIQPMETAMDGMPRTSRTAGNGSSGQRQL